MKNYQHQPLRKPEGWTGQDAALVIQLERQLDDIYRKLGALKEKIGDVESNSLTISEQELTSTEQSRVRNNIGAASASDLSSLSEQIGTINSKLTPVAFTLSVASGQSSKISISRQTCHKIGNIVGLSVTFNVTTATSGYLTTSDGMPKPLAETGYATGNSIINSFDSSGQRVALVAEGRLYAPENLTVGLHAYNFTYVCE